VGCGRIAPKSDLLRIAASAREGGGEAVADPQARLPGRGAYLCRAPSGSAPQGACLERALHRRAFPRALRADVSVSRELVESIAR
jgi:predicted RNA-binding protein YlxR (DUF448 family)